MRQTAFTPLRLLRPREWFRKKIDSRSEDLLTENTKHRSEYSRLLNIRPRPDLLFISVPFTFLIFHTFLPFPSHHFPLPFSLVSFIPPIYLSPFIPSFPLYSYLSCGALASNCFIICQAPSQSLPPRHAHAGWRRCRQESVACVIMWLCGGLGFLPTTNRNVAQWLYIRTAKFPH